jgi:hypothetical protein
MRVVALDGSVWWVSPEHEASVTTRATWKIPGPQHDDGGYARLMGPKTKVKKEKA